MYQVFFAFILGLSASAAAAYLMLLLLLWLFLLLLLQCGVFLLEMCVDWLKYIFLVKFNKIPVETFAQYQNVNPKPMFHRIV